LPLFRISPLALAAAAAMSRRAEPAIDFLRFAFAATVYFRSPPLSSIRRHAAFHYAIADTLSPLRFRFSRHYFHISPSRFSAICFLRRCRHCHFEIYAAALLLFRHYDYFRHFQLLSPFFFTASQAAASFISSRFLSSLLPFSIYFFADQAIFISPLRHFLHAIFRRYYFRFRFSLMFFTAFQLLIRHLHFRFRWSPSRRADADAMPCRHFRPAFRH
jgi:hypothetical protein